MKTLILVCRVDGSLDRPDLEQIEGSKWTERELERWLSGKDGVTVYTLSEFQDGWNNEELTDNEHWLTYIQVSEKKSKQPMTVGPTDKNL